jgi:hypothetical protein
MMLALDLITLLLITFPNTANYTTPVPSARHRRMVGVRVGICFALNPFVTTRRTYNLNKHTYIHTHISHDFVNIRESCVCVCEILVKISPHK